LEGSRQTISNAQPTKGKKGGGIEGKVIPWTGAIATDNGISNEGGAAPDWAIPYKSSIRGNRRGEE